MLRGDAGEGCRTAMRILTRMAEIQDAPELMDVSQAHIDGCGLLSDAGLEFAEILAAKGAEVSIPTTLNMGPLDLQNWRKFGIDEDFASRAIRQADAYVKMGCIPTWSCAPYQGYLTPRFGQQIAWGESNAICYANSVLGARTNRYGDYIDICAAITGRVPKCGLHLTENRRGRVLIKLTDIPPDRMRTNLFYVVLGHWLGTAVDNGIPVLEGLPADSTSDQLKALCAAAASSGATALFHAAGVTPEAPTVEQAMQGTKPEQTLEIGPSQLRESLLDLSSADEDEPVDAVVLGCPHFSYDEFRELANLIAAAKRHGHKLHSGVRLIVVSCESSYALMRRGGFEDMFTDFGVELTLDTCIFHTPMLPKEVRTIMTNSGKCAYYAPGELDVKVAFASLAECLDSAVKGRVTRTESMELWK